jgi:hypothetical protein
MIRIYVGNNKTVTDIAQLLLTFFVPFTILRVAISVRCSKRLKLEAAHLGGL